MLSTLAAAPEPIVHWAPWLWWIHPLFTLAIIALVVTLIVVLARRGRRGGPWGPGGPWAGGHSPAARSAEATLAQRFANGDIDEQEYRARLEVLRANGSSAPPTV